MEALSRLLPPMPPMPPMPLFGALVSMSALKHVLLAAVGHGKPRAAVRVGAVSDIVIYPVKSGGGLPLAAARVTRCGLVDPESGVADRHFMLVNETGNFISQRQEPRLSMVTPSIHGDQLHLDAPEMETLSVPIRYQVNETTAVIACRLWGNEVVAADCVPEASSWFSEYLGKPARLVWTGPGVQKRQLYENYSDLCRHYDKVAFQDWGQVLTISDASLSDLNTRLQTPVSMAHFRPNFTVSGTLPHAEDTWHKIYIADAQFTNLKLCGRCTMTTVDPARGVKSHDGQPLATLKCYRMKPTFADPCFGVNVFCDVEGTINVGDMVEVTSQEE